MKKLMSLLLLTFLFLSYDETLAIFYKIGPNKNNIKLPAVPYKQVNYGDSNEETKKEEIKFEFWYMDNKERPLYLDINQQDTKWIRLESGDRVFSPQGIDTLCYSFYKYKTDAASEYQCFDFKDRNKVFIQLIDGKFSGQIGTALGSVAGGETTAKALAFIGSKTPLRGKIRATLSGLSLANNIKNDDIKKVAFTKKLPEIEPYHTIIMNLSDIYLHRALEDKDTVTLRYIDDNDKDDIRQYKLTKEETENSETLKNMLEDTGEEEEEEEEDAIPIISIDPAVIDHAIAILVDPISTRKLLDAYLYYNKVDEFIHFINAINYLDIKNTIDILKKEYFLRSDIPFANEMTDNQKSVIFHVTKAIRDNIYFDIISTKENQDGINLSKFLPKSDADLFVIIHKTLQDIPFKSRDLKNIIDIIKRAWQDNRKILTVLLNTIIGMKKDEISLNKAIIPLDKALSNTNIQKREDGDFISQQIQPIINKILHSILFDDDTITSTIQELRDVWGEDSRTFNGIIRFFVYNKEDLIMRSFNDFYKNTQSIITKHKLQKDAGIKINEELSVLDHWALHPNERPNDQETIINLKKNNIIEVEKDTFNKFENLEKLYLGDNQLKSIPAGIFDNLKNLKTLYLGKTQLKSIPAGIFDNLTKLEILDLIDNQLESIPENIFDKLIHLTDLVLHGNQLKSIPNKIFDKLINLKNLYLGGNQLTEEEIVKLREKYAGRFKIWF